MNTIKWIGLFLLLIVSTQIIAQRPGGRSGEGRPKMTGEGVVKGMVEDEQSGLAVSYANIVLYRMRDQKMVTGGISDEQGKFMIPKVPFGFYKIEVDFIGYHKITIDSVRVTPRSQMVDLDKIILSQSVVQLEGVDIVADRTQFVYKVDKKVLAVSQDINAAGGTAADVLENSSMVDVDIEGNVSLRGSTNFTVFVNGRPSVLDASDALQQLPASNIENIEIITNPSVKYDPDGTAGIINIVLKKNKELGINGLINASVGTNDKYRSNVLLNYQKKRWNITAGFDYRDDMFEGTFDRERETTQDSEIYYMNTQGQRDMNRANKSMSLGVDYKLSDNTEIGVSTRFGSFDFGFGGLNKFKEWSTVDPTPNYYVIDGKPERNFDYLNTNLTFKHKFGSQKNQSIEALVYYSNREGISTDLDVETETNDQWEIIGDPYKSLRSLENSETKQYRFQLDYSNKISEHSNFEAGYQVRVGDRKEDYLFESLNDELLWEEDLEFSSDFDFNRTIHSAYSMYNQKFGKWTGQFGLRGEYTDRTFDVKNGLETYEMNRFDLFPSLHFTNQLNESVQMQISYSRRINRPRGRFLDPFISYSDENTRRQGNPDLKPEYIDAFEIGMQKRWGKTFLAVESFYRITNDAIARLLSNTDQGYILYTSDNLTKENSLGADLIFNFDPLKWLTVSASSSVYQFNIQANEALGVREQSSVNFNARLNSTFKFTPMTRLQVQMRYRGSSVAAQGSTQAMFTTDLALRHDLWNRKASIILQARDLFAGGKREFTSEGNGFYEHSLMKRESRVVQLTLSYRFNNFKQKRNGRQNGGGEDMDMDIEY